MTSMVTKGDMRTKVTGRSSGSSEERIVSEPETYCFDAQSQLGITVTREVAVSSEPLDAPLLHAALVGLWQGETANPRLVQR